MSIRRKKPIAFCLLLSGILGLLLAYRMLFWETSYEDSTVDRESSNPALEAVAQTEGPPDPADPVHPVDESTEADAEGGSDPPEVAIGADFGGGLSSPSSNSSCRVEGLSPDPSAASSWQAVGGGLPALEGNGTPPVQAADASALETLQLELINRARWNPRAEGARHDALDTSWAKRARRDHPEFFGQLAEEYAQLCARQPLVLDPATFDLARAYAGRIVTGECSGHICEGKAAWDWAEEVGVDYIRSENLGNAGADADGILRDHFGLMVDYSNALHDTHPLGHRKNIMREANLVGLGLDHRPGSSPGSSVQQFGNDGRLYLTGVVYEDRDSDLFYSPGEGIEGVRITVSPGGAQGLTGRAGAYAIPIEPLEKRAERVELEIADLEDSESINRALDDWWKEYLDANAELIWMHVMASGGPFGDGVMRAAQVIRPVETTLDVWMGPPGQPANSQLVGGDQRTMGGTRWISGNIKVDFRL